VIRTILFWACLVGMFLGADTAVVAALMGNVDWSGAGIILFVITSLLAIVAAAAAALSEAT
jgi:hypothetical protein